jgi:hypothetical protein
MDKTSYLDSLLNSGATLFGTVLTTDAAKDKAAADAKNAKALQTASANNTATTTRLMIAGGAALVLVVVLALVFRRK